MGANTKLLGKVFEKGATNVWEEHCDKPIYTLLKTVSSSPRIIFVAPSEKPKPYTKLALDEGCRKHLIEEYQFPEYLFENTWLDSNGFAGFKRLPSQGGKPATMTSWLRVLVKIIKDSVPSGEKDYYWHEMTFLVHQADGEACTVLCCDIPEGPDRFYHKLFADLQLNLKGDFGWREIQANLLRQVVLEIDHSIWTCSNAIRMLEMNRPDSTKNLRSGFRFPYAHDLLRHALHISETLNAACQNLTYWLEPFRDDGTLPNNRLVPRSCSDDMFASLHLLQCLFHRTTSNEARLRNEINLAFNVVSQQDAKAVRIISVVTLLFLPATFVSTLFSMSFFNYQPADQDGWVISPKIWVYFAVSIPLTIVTFILWTRLSQILTWMEDKRHG